MDKRSVAGVGEADRVSVKCRRSPTKVPGACVRMGSLVHWGWPASNIINTIHWCLLLAVKITIYSAQQFSNNKLLFIIGSRFK